MAREIVANMNLECTIRIILACICGGIIGVERTRRNKGADVRTHMIVAVGAALFVIVSKYGFGDVTGTVGVQADVARVASNVVTGVSFLGAGIIMMRGDAVYGLTTAAGIWMTAAIGSAVGCGMYITGIFCTLLVLFVQIWFHRGAIVGVNRLLNSRVVVSMEDNPAHYDKLKQQLEEHSVLIDDSHIKRHKDKSLTYTLDVKVPITFGPEDILQIVKECEGVRSIGI